MRFITVAILAITLSVALGQVCSNNKDKWGCVKNQGCCYYSTKTTLNGSSSESGSCLSVLSVKTDAGKKSSLNTENYCKFIKGLNNATSNSTGNKTASSTEYGCDCSAFMNKFAFLSVFICLIYVFLF